MKKVIIAASAFLLLAFAFGHDMWLESDSFFVEPGREVWIRVGNGIIYEKSENAVTPDRIAVLKGLAPDAEPISIGQGEVHEEWLRFPFRAEKPGNYWIGVATKPRPIKLSGADFNSYLEHDGLPDALEERRRQGILDREEVEEYSKYVKIFLQVGESLSDNFDVPLGLAIELVPQRNPSQLSPGDELPIRALYQGEPLSGLLIHSGCADSSETASRRTDRRGIAAIAVPASGRCYARAIYLRQVESDEFSYRSHWAALTFEVRERPGG